MLDTIFIQRADRFYANAYAKLWKHLRLSAIDRIKGLIEKETDGPAVVDPRRAVLVQRRVVPQQRQEVGDHEHEPRERDEVRRHRPREEADDNIGVEGLEDVLGRQRSVDRRVLVLLEIRQVFLPHVDHLGRL